MRIVYDRGLLWVCCVAGILGTVPPATADGLATAPAVYQLMTDEQIFDGTMEAVQESTLAAQVTGRIESIAVDTGDAVNKGQVLLRIQDAEQRARLDEARAEVAQAQAHRHETELDHARVRNMFERKLVARAEMDRVEAALASAQAQLAAGEARVATSGEALSYTVVKAPFNAMVAERLVETGETMQPGKPLFLLLSREGLRVNVEVPQADAAAIRARRQARVQFSVIEPREVAAESLTIFPRADEATHTVRVRVNLPESVTEAYSGEWVKVAFTVGETRRLLVPRAAVVQRSEITGVYVVGSGGAVSLRQVRAGRVYGDRMEILAGLAEGEQVALDPVQAGMSLKQQAARHE